MLYSFVVTNRNEELSCDAKKTRIAYFYASILSIFAAIEIDVIS